MDEILKAILLGVLEGLTEFIPVSSTGHLILAGKLLAFQGPPGKVFEIVIQLGAILAICVVYARKLAGVVLTLHSDPRSRRFAFVVIIAFLPAAVIGVLLHDIIKSLLFSPIVVCVSLIVGGVAILVIERLVHRPRFAVIEEFPFLLALGIGLAQTVAMIPGVSRSGATILGGVLMGVERKAATEFSFFLAIPTMLGATVYDLYKNHAALGAADAELIAIGFIAAFLAAIIVVRAVIGFITRFGFAPFGWYRIVLGSVMLMLL